MALAVRTLMLLFIYCHGVSSQSIPDHPSNIQVTRIGARAMTIQWSHSGNFGGLFVTSRSFLVTIRSISESPNTNREITVQYQQRSLNVDGLMPYRYFSSNAVRFSVEVTARNNFGSSSTIFDTFLPTCPGTCDYRRFTHIGSTCGMGCQCSTAYGGTDCTVPTFFPRDVQVVFDPRVGQDTPELTVKWNRPATSTLDGRVLTRYNIQVLSLLGADSSLLHQQSFTDNADSNGRNSRVVGSTVFTTTYMTLHYQVIVRTETDVEGDVASAPPFIVATHVPGQVRNLVATATTASVSFTWLQPADISLLVTGYQVSLMIAANDTTIHSSTLSSSVLAHTVSNLASSTKYNVVVLAINSFGSGQPVTTAATTQTYGTILVPPEGVSVAEGSTANFSCTVVGEVIWEINGNQVLNQRDAESYTSAGITVPRPTDTNSTMTISGLASNNGTAVRCLAGINRVAINQSSTVYLIVEVISTEVPRTTAETTTSPPTTPEATTDSPTTPGATSNLPTTAPEAITDSSSTPGATTDLSTSPEATSDSRTTPRATTNLLTTPKITTNIPTTSEITTNIPTTPEAAPTATTATPETTTNHPISTTESPTTPEATTEPFTDPLTTPETTASVPEISTEPITDATTRATTPPADETTPEMTFTTATSEITTLETTTEATTQLLPPIIDSNQSVVLSSTSVLVAWQLVGGASRYNVYLYREGETFGDVIIAMGAQVNITNLFPFTAYSVRVAAVEEGGREGTLSSSILFQTLEDLSSPPVDVKVSEVSGGLVSVSWKAPSMPNGIITGYYVTILSEEERYSLMYDHTTFSAMFSRPSSPYSVMVQAINTAGVGEQVEATASPSDGISVIIPAAVAAGGGAFLLLCIVVVVTSICCCCRQRRGKGKASFVQDNSYIEGSYGIKNRPPAIIPTHMSKTSLPDSTLTYKNPMVSDYLTPVSYGASRLTKEYLEMAKMGGGGEGYMDVDDKGGGAGGVVKAGEEHYAEIPTHAAPRKFVAVPAQSPKSIAVKVKKEATPEDYNNEELYMEMQKIYFTDSHQANALAAYEFDRRSLKIIKEIGKGEYGRVMKATAKQIIPGEATSTVAVKMLKDDADEKMREGFLGEAQLLAKFGSHPNVMGLLKVVCSSTPMLVIISYMPHGDLKHYLRKCARDKNAKMSVGTAEQLSISEQIAAGMEFLAAKYFIHRDLAARNVLVGDNNKVKISDFGLSRALAKDDSYYKLSQRMKMPVKWMALESLLYQKFSTYSDVWSYGVVLWEIFSFGETPYKDIKSIQIAKHVEEGSRLQRPMGCPQDVYNVMWDCWKEEADARPTFTQIKLKLKALTISHKRASNVVSNSELTESAEHYIN